MKRGGVDFSRSHPPRAPVVVRDLGPRSDSQARARLVGSFGIVLIVAPGAGALAVLWLIGSFAIVVGILMIALGFRLKGLKDAGTRRLAYGR
jgi:uncharacterized membrane protein